jgi:chromatin structure-remodeling complex protein RSC7
LTQRRARTRPASARARRLSLRDDTRWKPSVFAITSPDSHLPSSRLHPLIAMGRPSRRRAAAIAAETEIASTPDADVDTEMADADEQAQNGDNTPANAEGDEADAQDPDEPPPVSDPPSPPVIEIPRKRRPGRPPKNRPPDWDNTIPNSEAGADGTPFKRKRGRPSLGRGRGGRGGPPAIPRVAIDKEGTMADVINDEVQLPPDPEGETKVDENGNLQGGREYRVRVFTLLGRGDRLYMLSTEPARCVGYRDSYLFFSKNPRLYKITISDEEKRDLIDRDLIPHSYKGRAIGVCTARSVFREYGARILVGGKRIIDDYAVAAARARGDVEGELADPHDELPKDGEPYNKNQYVAWHGASSVYHTNVPSVPLGGVKPVKRKPMTSENWQLEHVLANR